MKRVMAGTGFDVRQLDHFGAQVAKWRYETVPLTMRELLRLKEPSQRLREDLFPNAQDKVEIRKAVEAGHDNELWFFMQSTYTLIFEPCESSRHWGIVCDCEVHQQMRRDGAKHIPCIMNSRRIKDAWRHCEDMSAETAKRTNLTDEQCCGDAGTFLIVARMLECMLAGIPMRFGYLSTLPWAFAWGHTVDGCQKILAMVEARYLSLHDPLTRYVMQRVGRDIQQRALGGEATAALSSEITRIQNTPLNEGVGEGSRDWPWALFPFV